MKSDQIKSLLPEGVVLDADVLAKIEEATETELKEAYNEETNRTLTAVDEQIKAFTGIEKNSGEKTVDFSIRAFKLMNDKVSTKAKEEILHLKKELESAKKDGTSKEDIEALREAIVNKEKAIKELNDKHTAELKAINLKARINEIRANINIDPSIKESFVNLAVKDAESKASNAKIVEINGVEYVSEDGNVPMMKDNQAVKFGDYIRGLFSELEAPKTPAGNGSDSDAGRTTGFNPIVGSPKSKNEAFESLESSDSYKGAPDEQQRKMRIELNNNAAYNKLPEF